MGGSVSLRRVYGQRNRGWHIYYWLESDGQKPGPFQGEERAMWPCHLLVPSLASLCGFSGVILRGVSCPLANPPASSWPFQQLPSLARRTALESRNWLIFILVGKSKELLYLDPRSSCPALPLSSVTKTKMAENDLILREYRRTSRCAASPYLGHISWHLVRCLSVAAASWLDSKVTKTKIFPSGCAHSGPMDTLIGSAHYGVDSMNLNH